MCKCELFCCLRSADSGCGFCGSEKITVVNKEVFISKGTTSRYVIVARSLDNGMSWHRLAPRFLLSRGPTVAAEA